MLDSVLRASYEQLKEDTNITIILIRNWSLPLSISEKSWEIVLGPTTSVAKHWNITGQLQKSVSPSSFPPSP